MANYSIDSDLIEIRRDILSLGITTWATQHTQAKEFIDRDIETQWYRTKANEFYFDYNVTRFDPLLLLDVTQLKRLSCYKVLELAYLFLGHEFESDPAAKKSDTFKALYDDEFSRVIDLGLSYDWNENGILNNYENERGNARRLSRV